MEDLNLPESNIDIVDFNLSSNYPNKNNFGEKCGQIFRNKSVFTYQCAFCLDVFLKISNFYSHVNENHSLLEQNLVESEIKAESIIYDEKISSKTKNEEKSSFREKQKHFQKKHSERREWKRKEWKIDKIFLTESEIQEYITSENTWGFSKKFHTKKGRKKYYRCNKVKARGEPCASSLLTFDNIETNEYILYRSQFDHTCDRIDSKRGSKRGIKYPPLSSEIREEVELLYQIEMKVKKIVEKIESKFGINKSNQVKNYVKILKINREKSLKAEIEEWLKSCCHIPVEDRQPFIINYQNDETLKFFISSKHLLANAVNVQHINVNGTKKLTWQNYTIYIVGTTNSGGKFKCFGIGVCQNDGIEDFLYIFNSLIKGVKDNFDSDFNPRFLCRDSSENLETAFCKVFIEDHVKVKICWNHVRKNLKKKLEDLLPEHHNKKEEMLNELEILQKSQTHDEFLIGVNEYLTKWAVYVEFITYFHQEWIDKNQNWYDGIDLTTNTTNYPLELIIKEIEEDETFRTRLPLELFRKKLLEWIQKFSVFPQSNLNISLRTDNKDINVKSEPTTITNTIDNNLNTSNIDIKLFNSNSVTQSAPPKKKFAQYKSHIIENPKEKNRVRKKMAEKLWNEEKTFDSLAEAEKAIELEETWGYMTKSKTKSGIKRYYRCNKVPSRGKSCEGSIFLFLKSDSTDVILVRSGLAHTCHEIPYKNRGLSEEVRAEIERLSDMNWKTKQIYDHLQQNNFQNLPNKIQISNYLGVLRERKFGASNIDLNQLDNWLNENSQIPENETKMFVLAHEINSNNFQFLISSKKLLQNAINMETINFDGVHKLEWIKFPMYILATTDNQNKCNCLGIAISSNEEIDNFEFIFKSLRGGIYEVFNYIINPKVLVTDNNLNIQSGFRNAFGHSVKIKICWDLVRRNIKRKLEEFYYAKEVCISILKDLEALHRSTSYDEFNADLIIFIERWGLYQGFINYFQQEWVMQNSTWFQGYDPSFDITNIGLENFVKSIKNDQLFRKKISLSNFIIILNRCVECWSFESESKYVE